MRHARRVPAIQRTRQRHASSDPFSVDPAVKERALRSHAATESALAAFIRSRGLVPLSPVGDQPSFDIACDAGEILWVAVAKSLTEANEEKQLRLGLGQILRYRQIENQARPPRAALITERAPRDGAWGQALRVAGYRARLARQLDAADGWWPRG